ncbi:ribosome silencing factor [Paraflavitalea sp. CAU 1676]|uniref:ribosome silencing factor n=1 Tax=Paraflavitalea sp. CAU 1676 TaxID=3032598 RepID=UPI0023DBABF3|nr:ribosome silencing factor [Paraflavitalea sp. CAU 1676]MDF2193630.1 ribosome silencing factor [Paraflavitalea sp. CAU 1676]
MLATRRKRTSVTRLTKNSKIFKAIIHAIQEKKGSHIISIDLRKIPEAIADFFIICEAGSTTQVKAIADFVEAHVQEAAKDTPYHHEGHQGAQWVIVDYVNIVVHVMLPETRKFYKLEEMWSDADAEEHK